MNRYSLPFASFFGLLILVSACGGKASKGAPPAVDINGFVFNEIYTCSQTFSGTAPFCADNQVTDQIQFTSTDTDSYEGRDVPDTGFVYLATLSGLTLTWTAVSPNGYTEAGTWKMSADGSNFAGTSHYMANDASYQGDCRTTGAKVPAVPTPPAGIGACL